MTMNAIANNPSSSRLHWAVGLAGLAWNVFGVVQFSAQAGKDQAGLMMAGMTAQQATLYASLPLWMDAAFGIGTIVGVIGCLLLLARSRHAVPVFAISLLAYLVLFVGDITEGVFAVFGAGQVAILSTVVAIAAGLYWFSRQSLRKGILA
jgi:hypothetical protein